MTPAPGVKTIEITVSPKGETKVEAKGFAGSTCRQATRALEQALGLVESDNPTAEFYQPQPVHTQQQQRG
jgi:hypothetical protein